MEHERALEVGRCAAGVLQPAVADANQVKRGRLPIFVARLFVAVKRVQRVREGVAHLTHTVVCRGVELLDDRPQARVPEPCFLRRPAQRIARRLGAVHPDDDRPGHASSLHRER